LTGSIHLKPTALLAERVLLPGDPGRALLLAQTLLAEPKMFNHNRGLWGYTGAAPDGEPLTIQSTGMGGPSAAIVISELAALGARQLIRVGTCGALGSSLALGELLSVSGALASDGASQALGADGIVRPDPQLRAALAAAGEVREATVISTDLFYDGRDGLEQQWRASGAEAVEMESATLFALAAIHELCAASLLLVSDLLSGARVRIEPDDLRGGEQRLGEVAMRALLRGDRALERNGSEVAGRHR
jgi:uridine phosphorylase